MKRYWVLFAVVLLSACNLSQPGAVGDISSPTATIERTMVPTPITAVPNPQKSDWIGYGNTRYPYGFQHPPDISVVENPQDGSVLIDDQIEICVSDVNPEDTADDIVITEAGTEQVWKYDVRRLKGISTSDSPRTLERVIIPFNNQFYVLTVSEIKYSAVDSINELNRAPGPIAPETLDLFNMILATVRFPDDRAEDIKPPVKTNAPCP
jgi:hypothetical protein